MIDKRMVLEVVGLERDLFGTHVKLSKMLGTAREPQQSITLNMAGGNPGVSLGDLVEVIFRTPKPESRDEALITKQQLRDFLQGLYLAEEVPYSGNMNVARAAANSELAKVEPFKSWINEE